MLSSFYPNEAVPLLHDLPIEVIFEKEQEPRVERNYSSPKRKPKKALPKNLEEEEMEEALPRPKPLEAPHKIIGSEIEGLI